jgi:biotin transport system ATP-binding protein
VNDNKPLQLPPHRDSGTDKTADSHDQAAGIVFAGVNLKRNGVPVLHDIDLTLPERRIGLVGDNGSGKSSLVRLLNGLLVADTGELSVFGLDARKARKQLPRHVGFIFQNPDHQIIFPSVEEELAFGLQQLGAEKREARKKAVAFLARWSRESWRDRPINELSEGQKQLITIFSVLIMEPRLIIFDEPFASLDGATTRALRKFVGELPQQVLMISHELGVFHDFDRLIWLHDGRIHMDGAPGAVIDAYKTHLDKTEALP